MLRIVLVSVILAQTQAASLLSASKETVSSFLNDLQSANPDLYQTTLTTYESWVAWKGSEEEDNRQRTRDMYNFMFGDAANAGNPCLGGITYICASEENAAECGVDFNLCDPDASVEMVGDLLGDDKRTKTRDVYNFMYGDRANNGNPCLSGITYFCQSEERAQECGIDWELCQPNDDSN